MTTHQPAPDPNSQPDCPNAPGAVAPALRSLADELFPGWATTTVVVHDDAGELVGSFVVKPSSRP
jgi:hypothetical protein